MDKSVTGKVASDHDLIVDCPNTSIYPLKGSNVFQIISCSLQTHHFSEPTEASLNTRHIIDKNLMYSSYELFHMPFSVLNHQQSMPFTDQILRQNTKMILAAQWYHVIFRTQYGLSSFLLGNRLHNGVGSFMNLLQVNFDVIASN